MEDTSILDTINLAIKSQEEIKVQLLAEIDSIETDSTKQKGDSAPLKFYRSSIAHLKQEKQSLDDRIYQYKQREYPALKQKLQRLTQKNNAIETRISYFRKIRQEDIIAKLSSPETTSTYIQQFTESLKAEIAELSKEEESINKKIEESKDQLHRLQQENLSIKRETAASSWQSEINDEAKLNATTKTKPRKRSRTCQYRQSAYLPPDPLRFSPLF